MSSTPHDDPTPAPTPVEQPVTPAGQPVTPAEQPVTPPTAPVTAPTTAGWPPAAAASETSEGTLANVPATEGDAEPGFVTRHTTTLITLMVAVIVAAVAIAGVMLYRDNKDDANAATEAAFAKNVEDQNATLETVECDGDVCAAIVNGQAYTVLVQEDENGEQHFGIATFSGGR